MGARHGFSSESVDVSKVRVRSNARARHIDVNRRSSRVGCSTLVFVCIRLAIGVGGLIGFGVFGSPCFCHFSFLSMRYVLCGLRHAR